MNSEWRMWNSERRTGCRSAIPGAIIRRRDSGGARLWTSAVLVVVVAAFAAAGCQNQEREAASALLADFAKHVAVIDDPMFQAAAHDENADPGKADEYIAAHEALRELMVDPKRKATVVAAYLSKAPTALRPLDFKTTNDAMTVTCALGPTDEKTAVFSLRKAGEAWRIEDLDGEFAKREGEGKESPAAPAPLPPVVDTGVGSG